MTENLALEVVNKLVRIVFIALFKLLTPIIFFSIVVILILVVLLQGASAILGHKQKEVKVQAESYINTPITGSIGNGKSMIFKPANKNLYYALYTIKKAESNNPETFFYGDFLSCGNFQQLLSELVGNNPKANKAKEILGSDYNELLGRHTERLLNWSYQGHRQMPNPDISYQAIIRGGVFLGYAREVPAKTPICRALVENHLKTGLFDQIAIVRLESMGLLPFINNYNLTINNTNEFVSVLCKSQGAVDCGGHWNQRGTYHLRLALSQNLYERE